MHYQSYKAADFAADESFVAYYLKSDAEAIAFWQQWLKLHPEKVVEAKQAERMLEKLYLRLNDQELQAAFDKFDSFLSQSAPAAPKKFPLYKRYVKVAVAAAILLVTSFFAISIYQKQINVPTYITKHNGFGKKSIIILSDGSKVILNSNSTLTFEKNFEGKDRNVTLVGEAFFEVAHDKSKPFIVKTGKLSTQVLGTKFNVCAYNNLNSIKVALLEGSVAINTDTFHKGIKLEPAEMAVFNLNSQKLYKTLFDAAEVLDWQNGTVSFNNSNFEEIAAQLHNAYGIRLVNQSGEAQWNYTGRFQQSNYMDIIKSICFAKGLNYQLKEKTITIIK